MITHPIKGSSVLNYYCECHIIVKFKQYWNLHGLFFVNEKSVGQKEGFFGTYNSYWTVIFVLLYKEWKTYSKRTFDYTDYDNVMWVIYYSNTKVVLFDKIIK